MRASIMVSFPSASTLSNFEHGKAIQSQPALFNSIPPVVVVVHRSNLLSPAVDPPPRLVTCPSPVISTCVNGLNSPRAFSSPVLISSVPPEVALSTSRLRFLLQLGRPSRYAVFLVAIPRPVDCIDLLKLRTFHRSSPRASIASTASLPSHRTSWR